MESTIDRLLTVAGQVVAAATAAELEPETAVEFCRVLLPRLLTELEIAKRVEARLAERFPGPAVAAPKAETPKPARKARKKAARRRKHAS